MVAMILRYIILNTFLFSVCTNVLLAQSHFPSAVIHSEQITEQSATNHVHAPTCSHSLKTKQLQSVESLISLPTLYRPQSFDVLHYDVTLNLADAPSKKIRQSRCSIKIRWVSAPDTFRFHLRSLTVDSVVLADNRVEVKQFSTPSSADFHYTVAATSQMKLGDTITYTIHYSGTMTGEPVVKGFSWGGVQSAGSSLYALGVGFMNNYVSATSHWMPCYDHPSDKATFQGTFICPRDYIVASNGLLMSMDTVLDGSEKRLRYMWDMKTTSATYLLTFAADKYQRLQYPSQGLRSVPIEVYSQAIDSTNTRRSFKLLPRMVASLERYFGEYPFEKVGYANTQLGAMEHQTMVCYPTSLSRSGDTVNYVAAHELAHQWFGDLVTAYDFRDGWLSESFATYSEALWAGELKGKQGYIDYMQKQINEYLGQYANPQSTSFEGILSTYNYSRTSPSSNYPRAIYERGSIILGMLRSYIGDTSYFNGLTEYLRASRFANATYDSVRTAFERSTTSPRRDSIASFLNQWIKGKGWATLSISSLKLRQQDGDWKAIVTVRQVQPDSIGIYTILPLEITFAKKNGERSNFLTLLSSRDTTFELNSVGDFSSLLVNSGPTVRSLIKTTGTPTITSVDDVDYNNALKIYPNPSTDIAWLDISSLQGNQETFISIVDALGRVVFAQSINTQTQTIIPLSLSTLSSGTYTISVASASSIHSSSLSIIR